MPNKLLISLVCFLTFYGFMLLFLWAMCKAAARGDRLMELARYHLYNPRSSVHGYLTGGE